MKRKGAAVTLTRRCGGRSRRPPPPSLTLMALSRSVSCSRLLKQLLQLQLLQNSPFAKQSQYLRAERGRVSGPHRTLQHTTDTIKGRTYSFRHCDLVQLHGFLGLEVVSAGDKLRANQRITEVTVKSKHVQPIGGTRRV